jgi:hypothetical protein
LNIYIYGNNSFKKEIHETLEHSNIKFKLDSDTKIEDIMDLELLKSTIEASPNDIYLIDDEKIIKKNALTQKIKFLNPKDGIKEEFLLDNGIADISVDSLKEIPKYILKKYEQQKEIEPNIQNSIIDIVDEAYENEEDDFELDDELAQLLSSSKVEEEIVEKPVEKEDIESEKIVEEIEEDIFEQFTSMEEKTSNTETVEIKDINLDELESLIHEDDESPKELSKDDLSSMINFEEDVGLNNTTSDYDDKKLFDKEKVEELEEHNEENFNDIQNIIEEESIQGDDMSSDFSELDSLNEQDILNALENVDSPIVTTTNTANTKSNANVEVASSNVQDIAELISKLLNNKTLEITIKIKD